MDKEFIINSNTHIIRNFIYSKIPQDKYMARDEAFFNIMENENLAYSIIKDLEKTNEEKIEMFFEKIVEDSIIGMLVGSRGSGKTAFMTWVFSEIKKRCKKRILCFRPFAKILKEKGLFDDYIEIMEKSGSNSILYCDEAARRFSNREHKDKDNNDLSDSLFILRHYDCSIIFTSQLFSRVDKNIRLMSDMKIFKYCNDEAFKELVLNGDIEEDAKILLPRKDEINKVLVRFPDEKKEDSYFTFDCKLLDISKEISKYMGDLQEDKWEIIKEYWDLKTPVEIEKILKMYKLELTIKDKNLIKEYQKIL